MWCEKTNKKIREYMAEIFVAGGREGGGGARI